MEGAAATYQSATYTALMLMPPKDKWDQIQAIRKVHDKQIHRWMPHINFLFPFVHPKHFDEVADKLQEKLATFPSFDLTFEKLDCFINKSQCIGFTDPATEPTTALNDLLQQILTVVPFHSKKTDDFHPHLTLGQFKGEPAVRKFIDEQEWTPINFKVTEIYMIHRDGKEAPFEVKKTIKLME
mmetsp:Transcript_57447/g.65540  ORF Transcript_57447/g.65540 Transcript_57447/m.65540 type:complete len:183 (+) Transcript_57447:1539-2087(+)